MNKSMAILPFKAAANAQSSQDRTSRAVRSILAEDAERQEEKISRLRTARIERDGMVTEAGKRVSSTNGVG